MRYIRSIVPFGIFLTIAAIVSFAAQQATPDREEPRNARQLHVQKVLQLLPPHSGLPPMSDLTQSRQANTGASRAWEDKFSGSMGAMSHPDPGVKDPAGPGSISLTTAEFGGRVWALPARDCDAVVIATPIASSAHLGYDQHIVYSTYMLDVSTALKGSKKRGIKASGRIMGTQLGGTIRYPSGHVETFLFAGQGFLELNKPYYLFLWRPIRSEDTYMVSKAYLIENSIVFPVTMGADVSAYEKGMPVAQFDSKVKALIAQDKNSD
jgi:hypothetical protein